MLIFSAGWVFKEVFEENLVICGSCRVIYRDLSRLAKINMRKLKPNIANLLLC